MVGWTEISEEQDHANSDFEDLVFETSEAVKRHGSAFNPSAEHDQEVGRLINAGSSPELNHDRASQPSALSSIKDKKGSLTNVQLLPVEQVSVDRSSKKHRVPSVLLTNSESVEEMLVEDEDVEGEVLNPDLIGASKALETGDLDQYAKIVSGHKIVEIAELMK